MEACVWMLHNGSPSSRLNGYRRLAECKALASNEGLAQTYSSQTEVEDYLKTYSSAGMDISCQLSQLAGGSYVTNVPEFDKEDFTSWKVRFLVYLDGLEHYLLKILEDGPFVPMSSSSTSIDHLPKPQKQWSHADKRLANRDKILKSIIISCLSNDVMKFVIKCKTDKAMWNDLYLAHEGPYDTRDTKIASLSLKLNAFKALKSEKVNGTYTRLKCLLNDLENNRVTIPSPAVNATFVNSLPRKWMSMNQTQKANNSIKNDSLATLFGKSSSEFIADLNAEYHEMALLANQKSKDTFKRNVPQTKPPSTIILQQSNHTTNQNFNHTQLHNTIKILTRIKRITKSNTKDSILKLKFLQKGIKVLTNRIDAMSKRKSKKRLVAESFDWDKESVSSDDEGVTKFKAFLAIAKDELSEGKADARSG
ncbi:hypothetical protein Tco_0261734 [Tanacetum coccineum]